MHLGCTRGSSAPLAGLRFSGPMLKHRLSFARSIRLTARWSGRITDWSASTIAGSSMMGIRTRIARSRTKNSWKCFMLASQCHLRESQRRTNSPLRPISQREHAHGSRHRWPLQHERSDRAVVAIEVWPNDPGTRCWFASSASSQCTVEPIELAMKRTRTALLGLSASPRDERANSRAVVWNETPR